MLTRKPILAEQRSLFEDKHILLNRGMIALARLSFEEAKTAFERFRALYKSSNADPFIRITDFLSDAIEKEPIDSPDRSYYLVAIWKAFEIFCKEVEFDTDSIIFSEIRRSFFREVARQLELRGLDKKPYFTDTLPTGYLYLLAERFDRAIHMLQAGIGITPNNSALFVYLGDVYFRQNNPRASRRCYQEAFLIDPSGIDLDYVKDPELIAFLTRLQEEEGFDTTMSIAWLYAFACVEGLFEPNTLTSRKDLKTLADAYLTLREAWRNNPAPEDAAKLFAFGLVLCENESLLGSVSPMDPIEVRRDMKEVHPLLFNRYLHHREKRKTHLPETAERG